jgi:hypothetical protein
MRSWPPPIGWGPFLLLTPGILLFESFLIKPQLEVRFGLKMNDKFIN